MCLLIVGSLSTACSTRYQVVLPTAQGGLESEPSTRAFLARSPQGFPLAPMAGHLSPNLRPDQNPKCSIAVSMSGGGTNSASYSIGALQKLNSLYGPLPDGRSVLTEIDFLPTASGGGLAALLLIEVMREHQIRENAPLTARNVDVYFAKSRFRSALDFPYAESWNGSEFIKEVVKGSASVTLLQKMETALTGDGPACADLGFAGSLLTAPPVKQSVKDLVARIRCSMGAPSWDDLRPQKGLAKYPAFLPTVSLFDSGHQIPATPDWLGDLGLSHVAFGLYGHPAAKREIQVSKLDPRQSVAISMSFPGIGPIAGLAKSNPGERVERVVVLVDGGQTDNLAVWLGFHALLEEHARQANGTKMVHLALDSALVLPLPDIASEGGLVDGMFRMAGSAVPQLNLARRRDPWMAKLLAHQQVGPAYQLFHVDAEHVLATNQNLSYLKVPADSWLHSGRNHLRGDLDLFNAPDNCLARECALLGTALERRADEVERLMALGAASLENGNVGGALVNALRDCITLAP